MLEQKHAFPHCKCGARELLDFLEFSLRSGGQRSETGQLLELAMEPTVVRKTTLTVIESSLGAFTHVGACRECGTLRVISVEEPSKEDQKELLEKKMDRMVDAINDNPGIAKIPGADGQQGTTMPEMCLICDKPLDSEMTERCRECLANIRDRLNQMCCHYDITERKPPAEIDTAIDRLFSGEMTADKLCDFIKAWTHSEPSSDFRVVSGYEPADVLEEAGFDFECDDGN